MAAVSTISLQLTHQVFAAPQPPHYCAALQCCAEQLGQGRSRNRSGPKNFDPGNLETDDLPL
jgi:hypothetical protein